MLIKMIDYCRFVNDGKYYYQRGDSLKGWKRDESLMTTLARQFNEDMFPGDWAEEFVIRFQVGRKSHIGYALEYMNDELFDHNIYLVVYNAETHKDDVCLVSSMLPDSETMPLRELMEKLCGMESILKAMARRTFGMEKGILDKLPTIPLHYEIMRGTRKLIPYTAKNREVIMRQVYGSIVLGMIQNEEPFEDACSDFVFWITKAYPDYAKQIAECTGCAEETYTELRTMISEEWYGSETGSEMFEEYHRIANSPEMLFALSYLQ